MSEGMLPISGADLPADLADENALLRASLSPRPSGGSANSSSMRRRRRAHAAAQPPPLPCRSSSGSSAWPSVTAPLPRCVGIDLNGLPAINERHGHFAGDAALVHVARLLCGLIRSTDMLARIGDDAFGLLLDHLDHNSAIDTAERLARCIADSPVDLGGTAQSVVEATIGDHRILPATASTRSCRGRATRRGSGPKTRLLTARLRRSQGPESAYRSFR